MYLNTNQTVFARGPTVKTSDFDSENEGSIPSVRVRIGSLYLVKVHTLTGCRALDDPLVLDTSSSRFDSCRPEQLDVTVVA